MSAQVVQKDNLTAHQMTLHKFMTIASMVNTMFSGNDINTADFNNSRVIEVPDIVVDDYIVDSDLARIGADHYSGSQFTGKWKNGIPPIEWRQYTMSRHRSFGYTVKEEQERFAAIKNLPAEYLARKMSTTVLRDHDKYLMMAIVLGRMTGKLIARTSASDVNSVVETETGQSAAEIAFTGNQADYYWIAQPGERSDNEIQPSFATIKGVVLDSVDPLNTLDMLTLTFSENWWDSNYSNSERWLCIDTSLELAFRDALITKGESVDAGFDLYRNHDASGANGPSSLGTLRGSWKLIKMHPEFFPKVFVNADHVVDPSPVLTGVGTAANRTLKQVVALAAYSGSAQTYDFFADKRQEDGGVRFKGTDNVQDFSYDAWVIDQKSEGIVPIFLPDDLDGNGTTDMDYTRVNDSHVRIADAIKAARQNGSSVAHPGAPDRLSFYPMRGANVNPSTPGWFENPYNTTTNIDKTLPVTEAGDIAHNHVAGGVNPIDNEELEGVIEILRDQTTNRVNGAAIALGAKVEYSDGSIYEATIAGNLGGSEPDDVAVGGTVIDGTATLRRLL